MPKLGDQSSEVPAADAPTLDYSTRLGPDAPSKSHPTAITLLIAGAVLAGIWSIILGVMSLGDAWKLGLLLIGAGSCLCAATMGNLPAKSARFGTALLLLTLSIVIHVPVITIAHQLFNLQHDRRVRELAARQSDFEHLPTDAESEVFTYAMVRDTAGISVLLGLGCSVYATVRLARGAGEVHA